MEKYPNSYFGSNKRELREYYIMFRYLTFINIVIIILHASTTTLLCRTTMSLSLWYYYIVCSGEQLTAEGRMCSNSRGAERDASEFAMFSGNFIEYKFSCLIACRHRTNIRILYTVWSDCISIFATVRSRPIILRTLPIL